MEFKAKVRSQDKYTAGDVLKPGESSFYGSGRIPAERRRADREAQEEEQPSKKSRYNFMDVVLTQVEPEDYTNRGRKN